MGAVKEQSACLYATKMTERVLRILPYFKRRSHTKGRNIANHHSPHSDQQCEVSKLLPHDGY